MAPNDRHPLDNVFWQSLSGPHAHLSTGNGHSRRYQPGFSAIAAFANPERPDLEGLAAHCLEGEAFYVEGWNGPNGSGAWSIEFDARMVGMAWDTRKAPPAASTLYCQPLREADREAVLELVTLTNPGPFGPLTLSMGEFIGHFTAEGRLIAMAGERTRSDPWHEVSGICTHPDHQGRGLGRHLTHEVVRRMLQRGELPFLHVRADNAVARRMYRKLGFQEVLETPIRVIRRV
jgi:ribosomal protein S18 acetylase RimI-like enzyme